MPMFSSGHVGGVHNRSVIDESVEARLFTEQRIERYSAILSMSLFTP